MRSSQKYDQRHIGRWLHHDGWWGVGTADVYICAVLAAMLLSRFSATMISSLATSNLVLEQLEDSTGPLECVLVGCLLLIELDWEPTWGCKTLHQLKCYSYPQDVLLVNACHTKLKRNGEIAINDWGFDLSTCSHSLCHMAVIHYVNDIHVTTQY